MSTNKFDVIWSPVHHEKFITWGSDITLYEISRLKDFDNKTTYQQISPTRGAAVVASQSASGVRCVDISAIADQPEPLLALGYVSGKVTLTSLKQAYDPLGLVGREFVPRYPRLCNSVSWSHVESNLLACATEKHRSDHCILLWDVHRGSLPAEDQAGTSTGSSLSPAARAAGDADKPLAEMGLSETAHSVSWARCASRTLVASMNLKYIKVFDLRDLSNKTVLTTSSRYCYGACADPFNSWQIASRGDNVVCVWDARRFERPLLTLPQPRALAKIQWSPARRSLLLSLQRDATALKLHDIQASDASARHADASTPTGTDSDTEAQGPSVIERDVTPGGAAPAPLAAFSWHCTHPARLLALAQSGGIVEHTVCERVTVSWGCGRAVWAPGPGGAALQLAPARLPAALGDVSATMRARAASHYGRRPDLWQNADLADSEVLSSLWNFLALSKSLVEDGCIRNSPWKHPGVRTVLRSAGDGAGGYRSEMVPSLLPDLPNRRVTLYRSAERTRALQLCGWGWGWENAGAGVERLEAEGTPCRAAALAAFHLRLRTALDVLARAQNPQLRVVALALAGLSEERLWREALLCAAPALPDAYLRALLHFLAASQSTSGGQSASAHQPDLSAVLNETEMRLEDRVAFACIFLSDAKLHEYVRTTCDALVELGDLSGILLTGTSPEGITLLQHWVENTGDVQTAALVAARGFTLELLKEPRAQNWLDSYREILDAWRLWEARCELDTWVQACGAGGAGGAGGARRVAVVCNYCGKSVAAPPSHARPRPAFVRLPPPAAKMKQISACPNCRKPLPRCGVCSLHLGGAGGAGGAGAGGAAFATWFSWCVACRHGGHAHHMLDWFKQHAECPVSSCNCRCMSYNSDIDAAPPAPPAPNAPNAPNAPPAAQAWLDD